MSFTDAAQCTCRPFIKQLTKVDIVDKSTTKVALKSI